VAKASGRKLKVFQAQFGFHDSVVAAPSQAAALRAWGIRQDLFAEGQARITDDPQAVEAARAHPELPLRRPVGSTAPFELEPTGLPDIPDAPRRKAAKPVTALKPVAHLAPADRSSLDAAEAAVHALDERRKREEARLREEVADLERKAAGRQAAHVAARKSATAAVVAARRAYRKAAARTDRRGTAIRPCWPWVSRLRRRHASNTGRAQIEPHPLLARGVDPPRIGIVTRRREQRFPDRQDRVRPSLE
jgi:hypothetical protein